MRVAEELPPEGDVTAAGPCSCTSASPGTTPHGVAVASPVRAGRRPFLGLGLGEPADERTLPNSPAASSPSSATHATPTPTATASGVRQSPHPLVLVRRRHSSTGGASHRPPSFAESQFATIVRKQRKRRLLSPVDATTGTDSEDAQPALNSHPTKDEARLDAYDTFSSALERPHPGRRAGTDAREPDCGADPDPESGVELDPVVELKIGRSTAAVSGRDGWPFAGWGSMSLLELSANSWEGADALLAARPERVLGALRAAAVAGNAVTGSIFYTLPAVVAAAGMWSPLSLLVACVLIAPFRWVMVELCNALGAADSANYAFFAHTASMAIAAVAAAATALDALATGAVSASTAATYLAPYTPGMDETLWAVVLLVALAAICCLGLGDSSRVALGMLTLHMATMLVLLVSAAVWWGTHGSDALRANWAARSTLMTATKSVSRALFDGVCAAFVGLTGFECAPSYAAHVKPGAFSKALLWLQIAVLLVEPGLMLLCLAALSPQQLSDAAHGGSANILALLGERVMGGTWLRTLVTVDAALVLAGGIITGTISFCGLLAALASDRIVPSLVLRLLPRTKAPVIAIAAFCAIALVLEATTGFSLSSLSQVFSLSFLVVLALYCVALFLARLRRPALFPRSSHAPTTTSPGHSLNHNLSHGSRSRTKPTPTRTNDDLTCPDPLPSPPPSPSASTPAPRRITLPMIGLALGIAATAIGGNIALNPHSLLLYALYAVVLWAVTELARSRVRVLRLIMWAVHESRVDLRTWWFTSTAAWRPQSSQNAPEQDAVRGDGPSGLRLGLRARLRGWMESERAHSLIYFARGDELSELVGVLTYVASNEAVSHVYVVHCYDAVDRVPSELEANYQLVDESFPTITVDLVFVESPFGPRTALAVAGHLGVPPSRCLIGCPHPHLAPLPRRQADRQQEQKDGAWDMADLAPLRIVHA